MNVHARTQMARPEVTGRKAVADVALAAFTIAEFCRAHRIHVFQNEELGPWPARDGGRLASADLGRSRPSVAQDARACGNCFSRGANRTRASRRISTR